MQVLVRLLGAPLPAATVAATAWTQADMQTVRLDGTRCLILRDPMAPADREPLAALYASSIAKADHDGLIVRGLERISQADVTTAAVLQKWQVTPMPQFGGQGLQHPAAKGIVRRLIRPG